MIRKAMDFMHEVGDLSTYLVSMAEGEKDTQENVDKKKAICQGCPLFTEYRPGIYSCGVPRHKKLLRVSETDGCGCFLNLKWWGKHESCPLKPPRWEKSNGRAN